MTPLPFMTSDRKMVYLTAAGKERAEKGGGEGDSWQLLYILEKESPSPLAELANQAQMSPARARSIIGGLANLGLVEVR